MLWWIVSYFAADKIKFERALILVREPMAAMLAEFNRQWSGKVAEAPKGLFTSAGKQQLIQTLLFTSAGKQ